MTDASAESAGPNEDVANGQATIQDPTGLHARPAVKLTKLAKAYDSTVEIRAGKDGKWVNAKSPNAVMKLKAGSGEILFVRAEGVHADEAVRALVSLIERDFDAE
ncbi:HPr family phosphocarrier protein [Pelagibius sp. Alg239-R121]|uniref:HPr family phosphocarrier protein n=1 Tax=Pelagibius sp. Alg239-R121 TaxID=2993448 RepID=UPI0024A7595F|nr:HPr family phosphocarrier protein [Pelagibius sp. Alg239-R121]